MVHWKACVCLLLTLSAQSLLAQTVEVRDCPSCPAMVVLPSGTFLMGDNNRPVATPQHEVTLKSFAIGKFEVTQKEWRALMGTQPSFFKHCDTCPVEQVTWPEAQEFVKRLTQKTGKKYRLPSEAEWEYACKAGQPAGWCGGDTAAAVAWSGDEYGSTHPAGTKQANAWGLHDMSGNVWEWTQDCSSANYQNTPVNGTAYEPDGLVCKGRVLRGGSWLSGPQYGQSVLRMGFNAGFRAKDFGFRVVREN